MKQYFIDPAKPQFKANMHGHTTCSDGKLTPEFIKESYMARGYHIYTYSDHRTVRNHAELAEENFLPLVAAELDITEPGPVNLRRSFHFNIIARDPENFEQVNYFDVIDGFSIESINKAIALAKSKNYIVVANHPNWTLFDEAEYLAVEGLDGFELYNTITANYGGALSFTPDIYLYLLRSGKKIFPVGADDNHSFNMPFENPYNDSFGGHTWISAEKLEYASVIKALDAGDCYCSTGPKIKEFSIDGNTVTVKTSDARRITVLSCGRPTYRINAARGEVVNELVCEIDRERTGGFILVSVVDWEGNQAMTRGYEV